ncbi:TerB family tellurite resistance protein [Ponticoccus litoralis]|uniref:TerB family tellurite resistance protein n=1 Tax=Ponticoccus litoralis TaxID=422297 RepID=A0AAW9SRC6_9RHOB
MFEHLKSFFDRKAPAPKPLPEPDAKLALGVLLVRTAWADQAYLFEEIEQIDRILAHDNGLNPVEAAKMRATCERLAHEIHDDMHMAELIRESVDYTHRHETVQSLWAVARADGIADEREAALVELIESTLGIEPQDSEAARMQAVIP